MIQHKKKVVRLDEMVRVGGRSKEVELAQCNLNQLLRFRGLLDEAMGDINSNIREVQGEFGEVAKELHRKSGISAQDILADLSREQASF